MPGDLAQKVTEPDIHQWLKSVGLNNGKMRAIDSDDLRRYGVVRVTLACPVIADELCVRWKDSDIKLSFNGEMFPITFGRMGKRPIVVSLRKVPGEAMDPELAGLLSNFGEVLNVRRKKYEGDEFIECFICHESSHEAISCPKRKKPRTNSIVWSPHTANSTPQVEHTVSSFFGDPGITFPPLPPQISSVPGIAAIATSRNQPNKTIKDLGSSEAVDLVIEALEKESTRKDKPQKPKKKETEEQSGSQKNPSQEGRPKRGVPKPVLKSSQYEVSELGAPLSSAKEKVNPTPTPK
ncbi:hypothetical protein QYM36_010761 [Artemia franciscana]|uniref:Uncharacterized protein n=1 Tax=Artemia franciscana TaxID=6661 RepID=A0AA88HY04_ARTSF|nr:hypothetical protein QYM36_010761 [Artemia franciscana]